MSLFFTNLFTHWKTSLAGGALAAWQVLQHGANWKSLLMAAATAALGAIAKDPKA